MQTACSLFLRPSGGFFRFSFAPAAWLFAQQSKPGQSCAPSDASVQCTMIVESQPKDSTHIVTVMFITPSSSSRRRQWHPTPVLLPGKSHGRRSLVGCSPWDREESDTTERLHFYLSLSCVGEGNGNPFHCSFLENPRDGGGWWAAVYGVAQSQTWLKQLSSSSSSSLELSLSPLPSLISSSAFPIKIYGKPDRRILRIKPCLDSSNEGIYPYIGLLMQFSNNTFLKQRGCFGTYFMLLSRPLCNLFP